MLYQSGKSQLQNSYKFWPYVTVFIGLLISAYTGLFIYKYYQEKEHTRLELASNEIALLIKSRMDTYEQVLRSGVGLFKASDNVSRNEWKIFVNEQKLNENFKGIQALGYSEVVLPKNKQKYEERIRKEGFADFKIHPEGERELYISITYLEPFSDRNLRAFGYDMFSEKVRIESLTKTIQSGEATLSGKIKLAQEDGKDIQAGLLMTSPIYQKGFKLDTPQERTLAIQGFVYAVFRLNDLMDGMLGAMFPNIDIEMYDGDFVSKENMLYDSNTNHKDIRLYKTTTITISGHTWTLLFQTKSVLERENNYIIFLIPSLILILTLLLYLLLNSLIKTKENAVLIAKKATQKLQTSEERLRFALEGSGDGLWDWNLKTDEVFFSKRWKEMLGFTEDELASNLDEWKNRVHPQDLEQVYTDIAAHVEGKSNTYINEHRVKCKDGSDKWILDRGMIVERDTDGKPIRMIGSHSDISERKQAQIKLEEYLLIIDKNVISSTTDLDGKILQVSDAFCKISGYMRDELLGQNYNIVRHKDMPKAIYTELLRTIQSGNIWRGEIRNMNKDGSTYWLDTTISPIKNEQGEIISYTAIHHDITDKKRVEELSVTDRLTQLYNRLKLDEIFSMKLASTRRYNTPFAVIMIDIDYFKLVNDTWGHQAGDDVLREFATIIKNNARETDIVGRWGGEEFLILSSDTDLDGAIKLSEKLSEKVSLFKFSFAGHKTASFGVSSYHAGDDERTMVKRADDALYRAKESGRNRVEPEEY